MILISTFKQNDPYHVELKNKIYSLGAWKDSFTVTGFIESSKVADILMASDAVLLPFRTETTLRNGSVFAAMLQGTPIVTTSKNRQGYEPELNIFFNKPNDIFGMKSSLNELISNKTIKKRTNLLTWRDIAKMHVKFYDKF